MKNLLATLFLLNVCIFCASATEDASYVLVSTEHQQIESNPQYLDLRPYADVRHLYIWENTALGETLTDTPYEGGEYLRLKVQSGWFGLGFVSDEAVDMSLFARKNMVLHFAIRTTATCPLAVQLEGRAYPGSARIALSGRYAVPRDGEWHVVEIPVSAFQAAGLIWGGNVSGKNYFSLISEGSSPGSFIDLDYIYFHDGIREDGTKWTGLDFSGSVEGCPQSYLIASEHTGVEGNPDYVDLRPNDVDRCLYIWENTATDYADSTLEPFEGAQFSCLHITNPAWFGFGFSSTQPLDFSPLYRQPYYLRFAISTTSLMPLFVKLEGANGTSAVVHLQGKYQFRRDGNWHVVQIPMSDFLYQGLDWSKPSPVSNYFSIVSEQAQADYLLAFDAVTIERGEPQPEEDPRPEIDPSTLPDYVLVATEEGVVPAGKKVLDLRPNGNDINLYVWENTAVDNPSVGDAYEGSQYSSLKIQSGWFGFGIMNSAPYDFTCFQYKDFIFHIALRTTSQMPLELRFEGLGAAVVKVDEKMLPRDGQWHAVEIPVVDLAAQGLVWDGEQQGKNYFSIVSEAAENGAVLDFDAAYFYSTGDSSVGRIESESDTIVYHDGILYAGEGLLTVVSLDGRVVCRGEYVSVSTDGWPAGVYIARQSGDVLKFILR